MREMPRKLTNKAIVISGGHLTTAIPLIEMLVEKGIMVVYVGRTLASHHAITPSREKEEVEKIGAIFTTITQVKIDRQHFVMGNILIVWRMIKSIFESYQILKKYKVNCVVGFGGYLSLPIGIAAKLTRIPLVIHEQTMVMGMANQFLSRFADKICLSHRNSKIFLGKRSAIVTGNLIRKELLNPKPQIPDWMPDETWTKPILLIMGGSQGSHFLNQQIMPLVSTLVERYVVIHQTGASQLYKDIDVALIQKNELEKIKRAEEYHPMTWIGAADYAWLLHNAAFVISRAGANTVWEILYKGVPSILIPLPNTHRNEQERNAGFAEKLGLSIVINQDVCSTIQIGKAIHDIESDLLMRKNIGKNIKKQIPTDSTKILYEEIMKLVAQ